MKKENFVIGLIGVAVVFFLLGRFSVSTTEKRQKADSTEEVADAQTDAKDATGDEAKAEEAPKAAGAPAPRDNPAANLKPAELAKRPTPKAAPTRPAPVKKAAGSLNVVASPRKGAATAKVTIMEISDFQ